MATHPDASPQLARFPPILRDDLLYLAVFGPGYGESILLRVPPDKLVIVDSLTVDPSHTSPVLDMMRAQNARWAAVVLTHPHGDHAAGLRALLDSPGAGPVGCVAPYVNPPERWRTSDDPDTHLRNGEVEDALAAIQYRWEKNPSEKWELLAGESRQVGDAKITVLHPPEDEVAATSEEPADPNTLASPLLVEWHSARVVLGSDLPKRGWKGIQKRSASLTLGNHRGFKVAHHGSRGALHDVVLKGAKAGRQWIVTPFHRGRGLPCFDDGHGVEGLLGHNSELVLTSLRDVPGGTGSPKRISRQQVRDSRAKAATSTGQHPKARSIPRPGMDPEGWAAIGFAEDGQIADRQYGGGAAVVFEAAGAPTPPKAAVRPRKKQKPRRSPKRTS